MAEQQSPNFNPTEPGYYPNSGNTNSGNTNSGNDTPPTQTPTPIPTPTPEPIPNDIVSTIKDIDGDGYVESVRTDIRSGREQFRSIRDRFYEDAAIGRVWCQQCVFWWKQNLFQCPQLFHT